MIIFWKDAVLSASVARAAAAAQAARAQVAIAGIIEDFKVLLSPWNNPSIFETGRATAGGCAPHAIGGVSDEDTNVIPQ